MPNSKRLTAALLASLGLIVIGLCIGALYQWSGWMVFGLTLYGVYPALGFAHLWLTVIRVLRLTTVTTRVLLAVCISHLLVVVTVLCQYDEGDASGWLVGARLFKLQSVDLPGVFWLKIQAVLLMLVLASWIWIWRITRRERSTHSGPALSPAGPAI
jgi:hypothetical protein